MIEPVRYRYAHDNSISFTESEWIESSWDYFVRLADDTDISFALFIIEVFQDHRKRGTIVPFGNAGTIRPSAPIPWIATRCNHWHSIHIGTSIWQCLTCFDTFLSRTRPYFCSRHCDDAHTMTFDELIHHERINHPKEKIN